MKAHTEYEILTPLQVAQIGECDGWPVEGLVVSDDKINWASADIFGVKIGYDRPYGCWRYCARPVETIEWEVGDLVETLNNKGRITDVAATGIEILVADTKAEVICDPANLKPWPPGYKYTTDGELITAPEGWEIVPEGEALPQVYAWCHKSGIWREGRQNMGFKAGITLAARAYARRIDPIAPGHNPAGLTVSQVGEGWRLLSFNELEIVQREELSLIEYWSGPRSGWRKANLISSRETYRTQKPEGYFLPKPERVAKHGEVWKKEGCAHVCVNTTHASTGLPHWNLDAGCACMVTGPVSTTNGWHFVAASLEEYYAKQQHAVTADMNEQLQGGVK